MAVETSLPTLLNTLTQSLLSASDTAPEITSIIPPKDGISLLDIKNELLLSYLQNLVFLILLKLRECHNDSNESQGEKLEDAVVKKLVELRVYLERGVRPLEGRLKYQIDKVLRAADDVSRSSANATSQKQLAPKMAATGNTEHSSEESDGENDSEVESSNGVTLNATEIDDLQYRPQPSSFMRPANAATETQPAAAAKDGIYRPPRITATVMPTTTQPRTKEARKPLKSATLDEFISMELSAAPIAEPSIGSTIAYGGRRAKSEREKKEEQERKEYEERNYVRLPKESKKERAKKKGDRRDAGYGGEEWRGLGEGIDRIERLTRRKGGDFGRSSSSNVLEKSRKRAAATEGERSRGSGGAVEVGQGFAKRLKTLDDGRRDRGRR
jgi:U3 small nucleolar ribonucleoprotein protein LCP5